MKRILGLLVCIQAFTSCSKVVYLMYGVKKPKPETPESINKYLLKINSDTSTNFIPHPTAYKQLLEITNKSVPDALIFSEDGKNLNYHPKDSKCDGYVKPFLERIDTLTHYEIKDTLTLDKLLKIAKFEKEFNGLQKQKTIVIFWTKFIGRLNKTYVREWEKTALTKKINVIKINMDIQESWNAEDLKQNFKQNE